MMANKIKLKKYLICTFITSIIFTFIFLIINIYEYKTYTKNFNNKLSAITLKLKENYPDISENEILEILNSKDTGTSIFEKYSIDQNNDSIVLENDEVHNIFLSLNITFLILALLISRKQSKKDN